MRTPANRRGLWCNYYSKPEEEDEKQVKEYIIKVDDTDKRAWDGGLKVVEMKEIVRCKDCVYWNPYKLCNRNFNPCDEDWYCADSKRPDA